MKPRDSIPSPIFMDDLVPRRGPGRIISSRGADPATRRDGSSGVNDTSTDKVKAYADQRTSGASLSTRSGSPNSVENPNSPVAGSFLTPSNIPPSQEGQTDSLAGFLHPDAKIEVKPSCTSEGTGDGTPREGGETILINVSNDIPGAASRIIDEPLTVERGGADGGTVSTGTPPSNGVVKGKADDKDGDEWTNKIVQSIERESFVDKAPQDGLSSGRTGGAPESQIDQPPTSPRRSATCELVSGGTHSSNGVVEGHSDGRNSDEGTNKIDQSNDREVFIDKACQEGLSGRTGTPRESRIDKPPTSPRRSTRGDLVSMDTLSSKSVVEGSADGQNGDEGISKIVQSNECKSVIDKPLQEGLSGRTGGPPESQTDQSSTSPRQSVGGDPISKDMPSANSAVEGGGGDKDGKEGTNKINRPETVINNALQGELTLSTTGSLPESRVDQPPKEPRWSAVGELADMDAASSSSVVEGSAGKEDGKEVTDKVDSPEGEVVIEKVLQGGKSSSQVPPSQSDIDHPLATARLSAVGRAVSPEAPSSEGAGSKGRKEVTSKVNSPESKAFVHRVLQAGLSSSRMGPSQNRPAGGGLESPGVEGSSATRAVRTNSPATAENIRRALDMGLTASRTGKKSSEADASVSSASATATAASRELGQWP
ncbi:unnamed protein product, partial [Discosporangium mesarthrocarpum]